ncbi:MAG: Chemotaxis protein PomA [Syntrophaceae bacterium PtaU1.Bin231]|nr:MAG: Chemotaxis protein PomA [Syntrophaceae bacterium PtaU1.Bin231]HOG16748.1 MotA/TolQ/ExbB proton channel family protein [Syntrophales bacterium]
MDFATIIGILGGFSLVFLAIASGGGLGWFVDLPSAMIVLGGTFGAVLINYPMSDFLGVIRVAKNVFFQRRRKTAEITKFIVQMSRVARREGVFSLQKMTGKMKDPFFDKAVELMVDGIEPVDMRRIMETELEAISDRHRLGAEIFTTMGHFAPAMGMMGTLIGLVQMMMQMNNPSSIGPAMAVALITTFYGVLLANLVFLPIAGKLKKRSAEERLEKRLIIDGILSIQSGDNPRVVEQKLHSFVSPHERKSVFQHE